MCVGGCSAQHEHGGGSGWLTCGHAKDGINVFSRLHRNFTYLMQRGVNREVLQRCTGWKG
jgi:hypothetical protein